MKIKKIILSKKIKHINEKAAKLYQELENAKRSAGYKIVGFVNVDEGKENYVLSNFTTYLGSFKEAQKIISEHQVEEVIIALESKEHEMTGRGSV